MLLSFLVELNEIIAPTGYSFVHYIERNYTSFFIYLFNFKQKEIFDSFIDYTHDNHKDYTNYWLHKAQFNEQHDNYKIAYKCFQKAITQDNINEYTITAISSFAQLLTYHGNYEEAKKEYKQGMSLLKDKNMNTDMNEWWMMWFEKSINKLNNLT